MMLMKTLAPRGTILLLLLLLCLSGRFRSSDGATDVLTNLSLAQAVNIAMTNNPHLAEAWANLESARHLQSNAGRLPNPEVVARMESAPISSITSEGEFLAGLSQSIPLGGRLSASRRLETATVQVREKELQAAALNLAKKVHSAFATALFSSEVLNLQTNLSRTMQELSRITRARVEQGDAAPLDQLQLEAEAAKHELEVKKASSLHRQAMHALATLMGEVNSPVHSLAGKLEDVLQIAEIKHAALSVDEHPSVAAMQRATKAQRARVELARAERIPDLNLELLYRHLPGSREDAVDLGIRIPIPIFDRGRSRVRHAESELRAAEARLQQTRNEISQDLETRRIVLEETLELLSIFETKILPALEAASRGAEARYLAGDISLSELLLVRRDATNTRLTYLQALRDLMEAWAGLMQGQPN